MGQQPNDPIPPMSMTFDADATQPVLVAPPGENSSPGCLVWGAVGLVMIVLAAGAVLMAALAGYASGLPLARGNATATRSADIAVQCERIASDMANGAGTGLIDQRLEYLMAVTPVAACLEPLLPAVTAYALALNPTPTPSPIPTIATSESPETNIAPVADATEPGTASPYDLDALLQEARDDLASEAYRDAIDLLDAIRAIDAGFQPDTIRRLLFGALTAEAMRHFRVTGNLAEGIVLTDRAEAFGDIGELSFERTVAQLYLDARRNFNLNYPEALRLLRGVLDYAPGYQGGQAQRDLLDQTLAYGDALMYGEPCAAVAQFEAALALGSGSASARRDAALLACEQSATTEALNLPTADPLNPAPTIQPIGVP
jgi:tetratricopeptide (TPR) repeat protein